MEQRIVVMLRCLRHDTYTVRGETQAAAGERIYSVELKLGTVTSIADFTATPGPESRWYLRAVDLEKLSAICGAK
jgi:hypothetical protein